VLTVVGLVEVLRPYYLCAHCGVGQLPADVELDIENTEFSPGVRRLQAIVARRRPSIMAAEQMRVLAGLEVTTKSVERTAEAIGADIAQREQGEIQKSPPVGAARGCRRADAHPVRADGWDGCPVVKKETVGRQGKCAGQPAHTREVKLGCVFSQTRWDKQAIQSAIPIPPPTPEPSRVRKSLAANLCGSLGTWLEPRTPEVVIGDGAEWIWNLVDLHFPGVIQIVDLYHARQHLWSGSSAGSPMKKESKKA